MSKIEDFYQLVSESLDDGRAQVAVHLDRLVRRDSALRRELARQVWVDKMLRDYFDSTMPAVDGVEGGVDEQGVPARRIVPKPVLWLKRSTDRRRRGSRSRRPG